MTRPQSPDSPGSTVWIGRLGKLASGALLLVLVAALFSAALGMLLDNRFRVEESVVIAAPPEAIHAFTAEVRRLPVWMGWDDQEDPSLTRTFGGAERGAGGVMRWRGERFGEGSLRLLAESLERGVEWEESLPGGVEARGEVRYERLGERTRVTWVEEGTLPRPHGPFFTSTVERLLAPHARMALEHLAAAAEGRPPRPRDAVPRTTEAESGALAPVVPAVPEEREESGEPGESGGAGESGESARADQTGAPEAAAGALSSVTPLPADVQRGICVAHNYQAGGARGYGSQTSQETLEELRALGSTWVSLTPFGFVASLEATRVRRIDANVAAGETDARVLREIRSAHALGLKVMLKPHVWVAGGAFRGDLRPGGAGQGAALAEFMESYSEFILHYAAIAQSEGVAALVIGVELDPLAAAAPGLWLQLIAQVRERYRGQLVYSANWDRVDAVPFWESLDFIGVQFYAPLSANPDAPLGELVRGAGARLDAYRALSERVGRPLLLTEVGYRAARGCHVRPHVWPEHAAEARDADAQAAATSALLAAVATRPFIKGVFIWKWFTDPNTQEEGPAGFSPRVGPTRAVLERAFSEASGS